MEGTLDENQYGFRKGKITSQPLFILRRTQEIQEEAALECHLLLLDWEKASDKVLQDRMTKTIKRFGIPNKIVNMINEIYREPKYTIVDKDTTMDPRIQRAGMRQGCPLSPYLFVMLMTTIMYDVGKGLTEQELGIVENSKLHKQVSGNFFYADDTVIMAQKAEAVEIILHRIEAESHKYERKLNQGNCIHRQMNAIHRIHFRQGTTVPIQTQADYLRGKFKNTGDHKPELRHRISATWKTVRRLDLLWGKSRASIKWKIRIYGAVTVAKLMYGLTSIPLSKADASKIDAFQMRGLRKILKVKHPYWSRTSNKKLLETANDKLGNEQDKNCLTKLPSRLIERQTLLFAHTIRLEEQDPLKIISIDEAGNRVRSDFRRTGRPRTKWYDTARNHVIKKLIKEGHIPRNIVNENTKQEVNEFMIQMAQNRHI